MDHTSHYFNSCSKSIRGLFAVKTAWKFSVDRNVRPVIVKLNLSSISNVVGSFVTENNKRMRERYPIAKMNKYILSIGTKSALELLLIDSVWWELTNVRVSALSECVLCALVSDARTRQLVQCQCNMRWGQRAWEREKHVYLPKKVFTFRQVRLINRNKCILCTYIGIFGLGFSVFCDYWIILIVAMRPVDVYFIGNSK